MEGIYLTPISRLIEIALAVSGIVILYFMGRIFVSKHAWGDGAQYEMLGLSAPQRDDVDALDNVASVREVTASGGPIAGAAVADAADSGAADVDVAAPGAADMEQTFAAVEEDHAVLEGVVGLEDRIVRFGFTLALSYLAITWFGILSLAMWLLTLPVVYLFGTAVVGKDPLYRWFGLTTEFD